MEQSDFYWLQPKAQNYAWGSRTAIPKLFAFPITEEPIAELWFGMHPANGSLIVPVSGSENKNPFSSTAEQAKPEQAKELAELVTQQPTRVLGKRVEDRYGPRLPYLLKILAAEQPLSLQVHPKPHQARLGWRREREAGVALSDPARHYKDEFHKPELAIALSDFSGLIGFRNPLHSADVFTAFQHPLAAETSRLLRLHPAAAGLELAFTFLLSLTASQVSELVAAGLNALPASFPEDAELLKLLTSFYPEDGGVLVALLCNQLTLSTAEASYQPAGQIHGYLAGTAVEIMANSDNVLRAGLTAKHKNIQEVVATVDWRPEPARLSVPTTSRWGYQNFRTPAKEFAISYGAVDGYAEFPQAGPRILVVLSGEVEMTSSTGQKISLKRSDSVFIPDSAGKLSSQGNAEFVLSYVP